MLRLKTAIVLAATLLSTAVRADEIESSDIYPSHYPTVRAVAYLGKLVEERTAGRHHIRPLGNDDLDSEGYTISQVRMGTLDMARVDLRMLNTLVPSTGILSLPYLFKSTAHLRRVLDGPIGDQVLADMASKGLIGLCFYDIGARSLAARKPLRKVEDTRGMKIRVLRHEHGGRFVAAVGAHPVAMTDDRIYSAFQFGIIDATEVTLPSYMVSGLHRVARFYNLTEHSMTPGVLLFSKKNWDKFSREDQAIIRAAAKDSVPHMRKLWEEYAGAKRKSVEAAGVQIVSDVGKQSFADILVPLYADLVTDPHLQEMVRRIQASN